MFKSIDYFKEQTTTEYKTDLSVTNYKWLQRSIINNTKIAPNAKRAGVPQIRFHDLRHSFATLSLEQGMDIKTISHMLGHTDAGFTMNTYMHVTDSMQQTVANAMGNLVAEKEMKTRKNNTVHSIKQRNRQS